MVYPPSTITISSIRNNVSFDKEPLKNKESSCSSQQKQVTIVNLNEAIALQQQQEYQDAFLKQINSRKAPRHTSSFGSSTVHSAGGASTVSFSSRNPIIVKPTLHRDDYTPLERKSTWYSSKELRSLQKEQQEVVTLIEEGLLDLDDPSAECSRGLESKTKHGNRERTLAIINSVCAVLGEQEDDVTMGRECDPEVLAQTYRMHTLQSKNLALDRALHDQFAARQEEE